MYKLLTELFYFAGLYFIFFEIQILFNPAKVLAKEVLQSIWRENPENELAKTLFVRSILSDIWYTLWLIIGLFTVNWGLFALISFLTFITGKLSDKVDLLDKAKIIRFDAVLSIFILLMIYKSHYFHTWQLL